MRLIPVLGWALEGERAEPLDPRLAPLLESIAASTSLARAVAATGVSYRAAWGLLRDYEHRLGTPLVRLERGRGARLTEAGEALLRAQRTATQRFARAMRGVGSEIGSTPPAKAHARTLRLQVAASHDLALSALADALPDIAGIELDLAVMGSLEALRAYADGRAEVAGFHVPIDHPVIDRSPFLRWLTPRRDRLVRFVDREQGLILPRGNPARVKNFRDLARRKLRFVNRQRGSGTRLLIDWIVASEGLPPSALPGYGTEEFTHAAVAATVASGGADAGFGLRAAAAEYRLAFVPLARERYFLAVRGSDVEKPAVARLIAALRGPTFTQLVQRLSGYRTAAAGKIENVDVLGPTSGSKRPHRTRKRP